MQRRRETRETDKKPQGRQANRGRRREISQVSSSLPSSSVPSRSAGGQQEADDVRRRQTSAGGNVQSRASARPREISQVSATSGSHLPPSRGSGRQRAGDRGRSLDWAYSRGQPAERNQPPRRPREISEVSTYSMPSSPFPGPPRVSSRGRRPQREPKNFGPGRRPTTYQGQWQQTRETRASGNMPYYPYPYSIPATTTQLPRKRGPQKYQYGGYPYQGYGYGPSPYPYYGPMGPYQPPGYGPYPQSEATAPYPRPQLESQSPTYDKKPQVKINQTDAVQYEEEPEVGELPVYFPPETLTGFRELPLGTASVILLLWLPRFFIPWISSWHDFNVYILSNPSHWEARNSDLEQQKIRLIVGRSIIVILSSVFIDLIRKKWELEYYVYIFLLVLFTLSPVAGGYLDVLLRAQFVDVQGYQDWWFTMYVLTQWAISFAFIMFPVQMACIYSLTNTMSRNAHFNWTALFVFLEFLNLYVALLIIPGTCPTHDWTQVAVWGGILLLLTTVTILTLIFLFAIRTLKYAMLACWKTKPQDEDEGDEQQDSDPFIESTFKLMSKKLGWFSMIILPILYIDFAVGVFERFVRYEDWDQHHFSSALGILFFSKMSGVILMALVMILVRKMWAEKRIFNLRTEILYLGVPHALCILALITMVGRFYTLTHLKEGEIVVGPIPDETKAVLVFVNSMFRNRTICISSEHFRPIKIRPYQLVYREIYDSGSESLTVTMEVDPCSKPEIKTRLLVDKIKRGDWKIYDVTLLNMNLTELDTWDYYRTLYAITLRDEGKFRPKVGPPQLLIFQAGLLAPQGDWYYNMTHPVLGSLEVPTNNSVFNNLGFSRNPILWDVPATGMWTIKLWSSLYNKSEATYAWISNCTQCVAPLEFEVENNSLYLMVEYYYEEVDDYVLNISVFDEPPKDIQFPMYPLSYVVFKLAEIAGPNSHHLPSSDELQKDWAVKISMALAGMASGGIFLGFIYLFWVDPPVPRFRTITLAVFWVFVCLAADIPRLTHIDLGYEVSLIMLYIQILMATMHFVGGYFMYIPEYDFRIRPN